jgi:UDP-glucose 4-epimerase
MENKTVLVTGGLGYIGSHAVVELISAGYYPVIVDNLANSTLGRLSSLEDLTGVKIAFEEVESMTELEKESFVFSFGRGMSVGKYSFFT